MRPAGAIVAAVVVAFIICGAIPTNAAAQAARDLANRPPSLHDRDGLWPTQVELYGLLNIGWQQPDRASTPGSTGLGSSERSRIGLRATEVLGRNLRAHMQLEQSLRPADGTLPDDAAAVRARPFDARATVGLSDRDLGRIDLGRMVQAAADLALRADPWDGAAAVGPGVRLHAPATDPSQRTTDAPACRAALRSSGMLSYGSPVQHPLRLVVQVSRPTAGACAPSGHGASLAWDRGPWLVGLGLQHSSDGVRHLPLVLAHDDGRQRIALAWTEGRGLQRKDADPVRYRNLFVGLTLRTMAKGDPERNEWRAGLNLHRVDGGVGSDTKFGLGWRHRLSRHVWTNLGAAWIHPQQGTNRWGLEATLTYSFQRDLRLPQGPR